MGLDAGTGIVHSAPAYGVDDFNVRARPTASPTTTSSAPVQSNGVYAESCPSSAASSGRPTRSCRETARSRRAVLPREAHHSYMHCWRHKTPLIYRATAQWFVGMDLKPNGGPSLRELALRGVESTPVLPGLGPGAAARDDRQPARLVHLAPAQLGRADPVLPAPRRPASCIRAPSELMEEVAKRIELEGIEAWFKLDPPSCWAPKPPTTKDQRHPRRLVRLRHHPLARAARSPTTATPAARAPTCTSKAPTSTAAGSTRRCSPAAPSTATRPTRRC